MYAVDIEGRLVLMFREKEISLPLSPKGLRPSSTRIFSDELHNRVIIENVVYKHDTKVEDVSEDMFQFTFF